VKSPSDNDAAKITIIGPRSLFTIKIKNILLIKMKYCSRVRPQSQQLRWYISAILASLDHAKPFLTIYTTTTTTQISMVVYFFFGIKMPQNR